MVTWHSFTQPHNALVIVHTFSTSSAYPRNKSKIAYYIVDDI